MAIAMHLRERRSVRISVAALYCFLALSCAAAVAGEPPTELKVTVGLSSQAETGSGILLQLQLSPRLTGSEGLPGLRAVHLSGDLGAINLRGIPTCKPTAESPTSGCSTPMIGTGRIYALRQFEVAGATPMKLHGAVQLYSGGQSGKLSKLYAWASFGRGSEGIGGSFVIPISFTRTGPARSEVSAKLPELEGSRFAVKEILLAVQSRVRVKGRSLAVTSVDCSHDPAGLVRAEASFFYYSDAVGASSVPNCSG